MTTANRSSTQTPARAKNKTLAAWLALLGGPLGLHRFYLYGLGDLWGWLHPVPTALGLWGLERMQTLGTDDALSWMLLPVLGLQVAQTCLTAIVYGLKNAADWNARHNPRLAADAPAGQTGWPTVGAVVISLLIGAVGLMSALAISFEHYYEDQVREGLKLSQ